MRISRALWAIFLFALCLSLLRVENAQADAFNRQLAAMIPDEVAAMALHMALNKIGSVTCDNGEPCAEASDEERANPPIAVNDARTALVTAINSARAQWCGLDYKRSLLPMIAFGKTHMNFNTRQLMLLSLIHADFMANQLRSFEQLGQICTEQIRDSFDRRLPKLEPVGAQ